MTCSRCAVLRNPRAPDPPALAHSERPAIEDDSSRPAFVFLAQACAPWGNVCVVAGTHYVPIALPSILGTLFLLLPLVAVAAKLRASGEEATRAQLRIEQLETELRVLKERL